MKTLKESLLGDMETAVNNNCVYYPKDKTELIEAIKECLDAKIYDLNYIDTSKIIEMNSIFDTEYGPLRKYKNVFSKIDISKWDVSNVENMSYMFNQSNFNGDISKWNVRKVKVTSYMFQYSKFNGDISKWDVSNVEDMHCMFHKSIFNGDISKWNVSNVKYMDHVFVESKFNGDISKWNVSNVETMRGVFDNCPIEEKYKPKFK